MNRQARAVIDEFSSPENKRLLFDVLNNHFNRPIVFKFLRDNFGDFMGHYIHKIQQDLYLSDPLPSTTIFDQVTCFNNEFIQDRINYIRTHVTIEDAPKYMVKDDLPTSRYGIGHHRADPNRILETWRANSGRGVQARDDPQNIHAFNTFNGQGDNHMATGIVFCDQTDLGTSQHVSQLLDNSYVVALNSEVGYTSNSFGNATPASDARLLQRRTFRSNEAGVENGVPRYESRLYKRNLERDVTEGLRSAEKDYQLRGYDMRELYDRIDYKNKAKRRFEPPVCKPESKLYLGENSGVDEMRYC